MKTLWLVIAVAFGQNCIYQEPATMVYGQGGSFTSGARNSGGISASSLAKPGAISFDANGNVYIVDSDNNRVLVYSSSSTSAFRVYGQLGNFSSGDPNWASANALSIPGGQGFYSGGVAVDSANNVFIADQFLNRVLAYAPGSTTAFQVYGQLNNFFSDTLQQREGISANSLKLPEGVAFDSSGNFYVADYGNNRVLVYARGSTTAFRVYGQLGNFTTSSNGGVSANSLSSPRGVAFDSANNVYIADSFNRVLVYLPGSTTAFRVYGQLGSFITSTANNGGISANSLSSPRGIAVDWTDNVYIADRGNNRVLMYAPGSTTAFRVIGQLGSFTSGTANIGGISASSFSSPFAISNGYIVDNGNNRVLRFPCYCSANFNSPTGLGPCLPCPAGTDAVASGSVSCSSCASGFFNPAPGQFCLRCPAGSFTNSPQEATSCMPCPAGTYSIFAGALISSCILCPEGTASNAVGATSSVVCLCPAGTYRIFAGALNFSCILCPEGTASNAIGATSSVVCQPCPSGTSAGVGSASCLSDSNSTGRGLPLGGIIGVSIGAVVIAAVVALVGGLFVYKRVTARHDDYTEMMTDEKGDGMFYKM
jgi:sugar lactone lactonase YvrE